MFYKSTLQNCLQNIIKIFLQVSNPSFHSHFYKIGFKISETLYDVIYARGSIFRLKLVLINFHRMTLVKNKFSKSFRALQWVKDNLAKAKFL